MSTNTKLAEARQPFVLANSSEEHITLVVRTADVARALAVLAAHDAEQAQPLKERPDFIAGYDAGLKDGRACERRDAAEQAAKAVPAGFKWVPVEPTPEMVKAGASEAPLAIDAAHVYRTMLAAATAAPAPEAPTLTHELQQQCSDWGVYWRASDAHGVDLSIEQAEELLRRALGVEVAISKAAPQAQAAGQDERAAFGAWFQGYRHGWKSEKDVTFDAWQASAALAQGERQAAYTRERHFALREAHCVGDGEAFWKARPGTKDDGRVIAFDAGYVRGFDRATELADSRAALASQPAARVAPVHQPVNGWTDADADAARLALELECLLTDGDVPMPVASRWWESAHEALALHRQRLESERAAMLAAAKGVME